MKRIVAIIIASTLGIVLLSAFVSYDHRPNSLPIPTVTTLTGDTNFSVTLVEPGTLKGSYIGKGGISLPTGIHEGDAQFGGKAVTISGVAYGTEKICFAIPNYNFGWRGNVYQWIGTTWMKMVTNVIEGTDGSTSWACANAYGNGTYALFIHYDKSLVPNNAGVPFTVPGCVMDVRVGGYGYDGPTDGWIRILADYPDMIDGVEYGWEIISVTPAGVFGTLPISGTYTPTFGAIVTSDIPYTKLPNSVGIKIMNGDECHAGLITID